LFFSPFKSHLAFHLLKPAKVLTFEFTLGSQWSLGEKALDCVVVLFF
jgi:hypothetical protein